MPLVFGLGSAQVEHLALAGLGEQLAGPLAVLVCNGEEAFRLTGHTRPVDQLEALAFAGRVRTVVITDGMRGTHALHQGRMVHVPTYSDGREVVDETGAGEAVQAVLGHWLVQGWGVEDALQAAARQGFEVVTALGATTQLLGEEELREHVRGMAEWAA